jgi:hypothetical protein
MLQGDLRCTVVDEQDIVEKYLAGRLNDAEAREFEAHWFGCDTCWAKVHLAAKVRAAAEARPVDVPANPPLRSSVTSARMALWGVAAALVLVVGGFWVAGRHDAVRIERSGAGLDHVTVLKNDEGLSLTWDPVSGAARYRVEVVKSDGQVAITREVQSPMVQLDRSAIAAGATVTVEAYSALGDKLATSPTTPLN